jgi:hypothetical protein
MHWKTTIMRILMVVLGIIAGWGAGNAHDIYFDCR